MLSGCVVKSYHPFYTESSKIEFPQSVGSWDLTLDQDKPVKGDKPTWFFEKNRLTAYDTEGKFSRFTTVFFKIGEDVYCDFSPEYEEHTFNLYWLFMNTDLHTVCRVEEKEGDLWFSMLNYEWIVDQIKAESKDAPQSFWKSFGQKLKPKAFDLPFIWRQMGQEESDKDYLFTASSEEWQDFLRKNSRNIYLFPKPQFVLSRHRALEPLPCVVPDERTAVLLGETILTARYGGKMTGYKPFKAKLYNDVWTVSGFPRSSGDLSVPEISIHRRDGRVTSKVDSAASSG